MKASLRVRAVFVCGLVAIVSAAARADAPQDAANHKERLKRLDAQFQQSLGWYRVSAGPDSEVIKPQSVLRWTNATRGQEGEPTLILWSDRGRPLALSSVYPWDGFLVYDCVSLARGVGLTAREDGRTVWSPVTAGVTFRDVPDAPEPAKAAAGRLAQAKAIAERYRVTMTGLKPDLSDREEMRLLPRPIYRYTLVEGGADHPDLIDGAVFAFVQGTDPEAVLLVEAVRRDGRGVWQAAFGRATEAGLEARLGTAVVWTAPRTTGSPDPKSIHVILGRPLVK
jgi:hypothetical protein